MVIYTVMGNLRAAGTTDEALIENIYIVVGRRTKHVGDGMVRYPVSVK